MREGRSRPDRTHRTHQTYQEGRVQEDKQTDAQPAYKPNRHERRKAEALKRKEQRRKRGK